MPQLGPSALVVRGGARLILDVLMEQLEDAVDDGDGPVLSVYCADPIEGEDQDRTLSRIRTVADIPTARSSSPGTNNSPLCRRPTRPRYEGQPADVHLHQGWCSSPRSVVRRLGFYRCTKAFLHPWDAIHPCTTRPSHSMLSDD